MTKIEWTDRTLNPIRARDRATGRVGWWCVHASEGCRNCYSEKMNGWRGNRVPFKAQYRARVEMFLDGKTLAQPLSWRKPQKIFVCDMTDLFGDFVRDEWLDKLFTTMALSPQHTFQILTKRPERMRAYLTAPDLYQRILRAADPIRDARPELCAVPISDPAQPAFWPQIWLGVSVENQATADARREHMRALAELGWLTWVSYEPALGWVDWSGWEFIRWLVSGGESGPNARPSHPGSHRTARDFCAAHGIAYFFKQWGAWLPLGQHLPGRGQIHGSTAVRVGFHKLHYGGAPDREPDYAFAERGVPATATHYRVGKKAAGRLLDGRTWDEFPKI